MTEQQKASPEQRLEDLKAQAQAEFNALQVALSLMSGPYSARDAAFGIPNHFNVIANMCNQKHLLLTRLNQQQTRVSQPKPVEPAVEVPESHPVVRQPKPKETGDLPPPPPMDPELEAILKEEGVKS